MKGREAVHSSARTGGSDGWQTPDNVLDLVRQVFDGGINVDPATTDENPTNALRYHTPERDGLAAHWPYNYSLGGTVFLNPPYGAIRPWMAKAAHEAERFPRLQIIALVPVRTGARWWQESVAGKADAICFWKGRLKFKGVPTSAPFDSALVFYGDRAKAFARVFGPFGWTVIQ